MKIAVPVIGTRVAPRLCFARDFLIVLAENGASSEQQSVCASPFARPHSLVEWITRQQIGTVLCCGANRWAIAALESRGVEVIWGLIGEAEEQVEAYLSGSLVRDDGSRSRPGGGRGKGCGQGRRNRMGRGRGEARGGCSSRGTDGRRGPSD